LKEFQEKTGSLIAEDLLKTWPAPVSRFVKVTMALRINTQRLKFLQFYMFHGEVKTCQFASYSSSQLSINNFIQHTNLISK
jgi:hypothetical protein